MRKFTQAEMAESMCALHILQFAEGIFYFAQGIDFNSNYDLPARLKGSSECFCPTVPSSNRKLAVKWFILFQK